MCGIAGLIGTRPVNPGAVTAMTALMAHRGPDDEGLWTAPDGMVALGHRRLSVIDTSAAGHQPMVDASGDLVIVFNGEIYNYPEVAARHGARLSSHSDTEVILAAYRAVGPACVQDFNGMFAFALLDRRARKLFCARDRFGEKPFLFSDQGGVFAFASEYKALLALSHLAVEPDEVAVARFLRTPPLGIDHGRDTVFPGIRQLLPGECLTVDLDTLDWRAERYWSPGPRAEHKALPDPDAVALFRDLAVDAVRLRMRSDVPLGSCLSGGLDSSAIVCIARNLLGDDAPYHVFNGRFPGSAADEGPFADRVAAAARATMHRVEPDPRRFAEEIGEFLWLNELPVDSASQYAQWCVFRLAREHGITVLLDGQGADEVLGGYEQYFSAYLASLAPAERAAEEAAIRARYPMALSTRDQDWKRRLPLRRLLARASGRGSDVAFGLRADAARAVLASDRGRSEAATLAEALRRDSFDGFLTTLLRYGDRNSMAHSREVRLPFCDHRLIDLSLSVGPRTLMGEAQTKRLMRESLRGILPEPIRTRWNKQGFVPPHGAWFKDGGLIDLAEAVFDDPSFAADPVWDAGWWRAAAARFRTGETGLAPILWKPMIAGLWRRHVLDRLRAMPKHSALA